VSGWLGTALLAMVMAAIGAGTTPAIAGPIVIAHRGASGERPEHTLASYNRAIDQGADYIEPDLVMTRDGVLVARHENEISETTDVAAHPEFADRRTTKTIDGAAITGWFTEDFTLAELKTLRARERLPALRPANTAFDGMETVPTFDEILALVRRREAETGRRIGIYPETKHPSHFAAIGLPLEPALVAALAGAGYNHADDPIFIQSFEYGNLVALRAMTALPLVQLVAAEGGPADRPDLSYADLLSDAGLADLAGHVQAIGVEKVLVIPRDGAGRTRPATDLVARAHKAGLGVHVWTLRRENYFLPTDLRHGDDPAGQGGFAAEVRAFAAAGVDGLFSDNPADALAALGR